MNNRTLCLSALIAVFFALTLSASAQRGVQNDYKEYQRLFLAGAEPDLSPEGDTAWRRKYERNGWAEEAKDGNTEAKILTALYLLSSVDQQLEVEMERIILSNPTLVNTLAAKTFLDRLDGFFRRNPSVVNTLRGGGNPYDLYKVGVSDHVKFLQDTDELLRAQITGGISMRVRRDNQRLLKMFQTKDLDETPAKQWADIYYYMQERFDLLQELRKSFYHNLNEEECNKKIEALKNDPTYIKSVKLSLIQELGEEFEGASSVRVVRMGGKYIAFIKTTYAHYGFTPLLRIRYLRYVSTENGITIIGENLGTLFPDGKDIVNMSTSEFLNHVDLETIVNNLVPQAVAGEFASRVERHKFHRYLIDAYQDFDHHIDTMKRIEKYLCEGAKTGDLLAMYHYGLFVKCFGDLLEDEHPQQTAQKWLDRAVKNAAALPEMKKRLEDLTKQFTAQDAEKNKREKKKKERIKKLIELEEGKIDAVDEALVKAADRIIAASGNQGNKLLDATKDNGNQRPAPGNQPQNNNP